MLRSIFAAIGVIALMIGIGGIIGTIAAMVDKWMEG